jgi:hypothetical protein
MNLLEYLIKKINELLLNVSLADDSNRQGVTTNKYLSNRDIISSIFKLYLASFEEESTQSTMLYHTCFLVYLHSSDFQKRKDSFNILARDLAIEFNAYNRKRKQEFRFTEPHAKYWMFQFIELKEGITIEGLTKHEAGEIFVISTLYTHNSSQDNTNIGSNNNIKLTKHLKDSNPIQLNNINYNAFLDVDMLPSNQFKININSQFKNTKEIPLCDDQTANSSGYYLQCSHDFIDDTHKGDKYIITTNYLFISGREDKRKGYEYAKINADLPNSIVQIKQQNNTFFLAAFGKVRLNGALVQESLGNPNWFRINNGSNFLINDIISIDFCKK